MIDLHTHTICSDGELSPGELVTAAQQRGLQAVAITDHDTVSAFHFLPERELGLEVLTGIELSVEFSGGTFHLLGYHLDPTNHELLAALEKVRAWRAKRNRTMVELLANYGLPVSMDEVRDVAAGGPVGRPHMAVVLQRNGAVDSIQQAFELYLADGRPCYVAKSRMTPGEAIGVIHAAGGAAVLAHPYQLRLSPEALHPAVAAWAGLGLDGLEVWYHAHTPAMNAEYWSLARHHGLCVTVGSDFHGALKPDVQLGGVPGEPPPDEAVLTALRAAAERWQ